VIPPDRVLYFTVILSRRGEKEGERCDKASETKSEGALPNSGVRLSVSSVEASSIHRNCVIACMTVTADTKVEVEGSKRLMRGGNR